MADVDGGGGKSGKKNQKRRAKAKKNNFQDGSGSSSHQHEPQVDPVEELRQRLADAKISKDHKLAGKLRQQLWIVQDLAAGVKPRVDQDDRDGQAMVEEFERTGIISLQPNKAIPAQKVEEEVPKSSPVFFTPVVGGAVLDDKRLKNLNKKLKQIEALKERQKKGEKLESNQLEKIKSEASVRQEILETEELISKIAAGIMS